MLNSVQHNVPAWTMFAMFFILYPLAGNFIKEREEGSMLRLRLISGSQFPVIAGKFAFYFIVCLIQFLMMIAVGIFIMPLLGLKQISTRQEILRSFSSLHRVLLWQPPGMAFLLPCISEPHSKPFLLGLYP